MDQDSIDKIVAECKKETKITYGSKGGFFTPRLRSINHLEVGYSKIISNPLTILLERFYLWYKDLRDWFQRLKLKLFPRHDKIIGEQFDQYITGKLTFKKREEPRDAISNMKVELWARSRFYQWRKLAEGFTDVDGVFNLAVDLRAARKRSNRKNLTFEVHEISSISYDAGGKGQRVYSIFHKQIFPKSYLIGMGFNLREIQLDYWNYRTDVDIPRTLLNFENGDEIQDYTKGRKDALFEQIIPIELTKLKHMAAIKDGLGKISHQVIQDDYPINLTQAIEKKIPGYTRGDEWFGERMMNGMNCGKFEEVPEEDGVFLIKYFGICNYDHNDEYALPDVLIKFRLNKRGVPIPFSITLTGALNAINKDPWQKREFTPDDGEMLWLAAKRIARTVGSVCTEVDEHFTGTHVNVEQYAIATYRNFKNSPLALLMVPHMREVSLINKGADKLIIKGFLPKGGAIEADGLVKRVKDVLGTLDWKHWKPMKPISNHHNYARAENLFWQVINEYVDSFFEEHLDNIIENWIEVYHFSHDLVNHSVPVYLSDVDLGSLSEDERNQAKDRFDYYSHQYGFDQTANREKIDGLLRTVSLITDKKTISKADSIDLENLKSALKYAIMQATFMHTWINEHQYDDLGEVLYNNGGLRFGDKETGVLVPESDTSVAPDLTISTQQMWFANFLSRTEYGFITINEDGDVNPLLANLLESKRKEFEALGVNIDDIESRTNI